MKPKVARSQKIVSEVIHDSHNMTTINFFQIEMRTQDTLTSGWNSNSTPSSRASSIYQQEKQISRHEGNITPETFIVIITAKI